MKLSGVLTLYHLNPAEVMFIMKHFITAHHFKFLQCFDNAFNQDFKMEDLYRGVSEELIQEAGLSILDQINNYSEYSVFPVVIET